MFDISKLAIEDIGKYHVTDAKGNPQYDEAGNPITITLHSPGTKKASRAQFKRDEARNARMVGMASGKTSKRTDDDEIRERAAFLEEITVSLDGFDYPGGPKALYSNLPLGHIAKGVQRYFDDEGNFVADSLTSSSSTPDTQPG